MLGTIIVIAVLVLIVINCIYSLWEEHQRGFLCECPGDCSHCKIQCTSNPKYYGTRQSVPPETRRISVENALRPENQPLIIRFIRKSRNMMDLACYWMFNLFGVVTAAGLLYGMGQKILSMLTEFIP